MSQVPNKVKLTFKAVNHTVNTLPLLNMSLGKPTDSINADKRSGEKMQAPPSKRTLMDEETQWIQKVNDNFIEFLVKAILI